MINPHVLDITYFVGGDAFANCPVCGSQVRIVITRKGQRINEHTYPNMPYSCTASQDLVVDTTTLGNILRTSISYAREYIAGADPITCVTAYRLERTGRYRKTILRMLERRIRQFTGILSQAVIEDLFGDGKNQP